MIPDDRGSRVPGMLLSRLTRRPEIILMKGTFNRAWRIGILLSLAWHHLHGQTIRVSTADARTVGHVVNADSQTLTIVQASGVVARIRRADIMRVERHVTHAEDGAVILGLAGAALGVIGVTTLARDCEPSFNCNHGGEVLQATLVGAGFLASAGALTGAVIGHFIGGWQPIERDGSGLAITPSVLPGSRFSLDLSYRP